MLAEIVWDQNTFAVIGVFSVPIVAIAGAFWYKLERAKSDNELKRSMVERGMSAADIERIIMAKGHKDD